MNRPRCTLAMCALLLSAAVPLMPVTGDGPPPAPGEPEISSTDAHRRVAVWRLTDAAGYQLSDTVVTADGAELASDPETGKYPAYGTLSTGDLVLADVVRWVRLDVDSHVPGGCSITLSVSTDGGTSWRVVPSNGSLDRVSPAGGKLRVRAELRNADPGSTPTLYSLWLEATVDIPPEIISLECTKGDTVYKRDQSVLNSKVIDPDGDAVLYSWSQTEGPDARLGRTDQPSLAFTPYYNGPHTFRLEVSDGFGASRSSEITILVVNRPPFIDFYMEDVPYKNTPVHIYAIVFSAEGTLVDFKWNLSDAPPFTTLLQPTKPDIILHSFFTGPCTVSLTVTDDEGTKGQNNFTFEFIGHPPKARLGADRNDGHLGQEFRFTAAGSSDPDGDRLQYRFDFGDGTLSDWVYFDEISHVFERPGQYTVRVRARDIDGLVSDAQYPVRVRPRNQPPSAAFTVTPGDLAVPFEFVSVSTDTDGSITLTEWSFGDGGTASGAVVSHVYKAPGNYTVRLWVQDDDGESSQATATININRPPALVLRNPPGDLAVAPEQGFDLSVEAVDPDGDPLSYSWSVNGEPLEGESSSRHRFVPGKESDYQITVLVDDGRGGDANYTWNLTVISPPAAEPPPVYTILYIIIAALAVQGLFLARKPLFDLGRRARRMLPGLPAGLRLPAGPALSRPEGPPRGKTDVAPAAQAPARPTAPRAPAPEEPGPVEELEMEPPPGIIQAELPPPEAWPVMENLSAPEPLGEAPAAEPLAGVPAPEPLAGVPAAKPPADLPGPEPLAEALRPEERPQRHRPPRPPV